MHVRGLSCAFISLVNIHATLSQILMNVQILKLMSVMRVQPAAILKGAMSVYALFHGVNKLTTLAVHVSSIK